MSNVYKTNENAIISFSGGRTSAYMLRRVLDAYDGVLPDNIKVCFANTGKEMPETLDFVKRCADEWKVSIAWLERFATTIPEVERTGRAKYRYETKIVTYETASRKGEPFEALVMSRGYAPNPVARFCTVDLKIRAIKNYVTDTLGWPMPFLAYIGIRKDEERRAAKMIGTTESGQERILPLWADGITKSDIGNFWKSNSFDLELPNINGTTPLGNCDLCFLKGQAKKISIIREQPDRADWWISVEAKLSPAVGKGAFFRADQPNYKQMKIIATSQQSLDFDDNEIGCFCGD